MPRYNDTTPQWMLCPACARTSYQLLNPDCPICAGRGLLQLGTPALALYDPPTVSEAVRLALEGYARTIIDGTTLSAPRHTLLARTVERLIAAGLLHSTTPTPAPPKFDTARELAEHVTGIQLTLFDVNVADPNLAPYQYAETDRPLARGLPVLSAAGHPSAVAMIADPADPFGSTRAQARIRRRTTVNAHILVQAHESAAQRRTRRGVAA